MQYSRTENVLLTCILYCFAYRFLLSHITLEGIVFYRRSTAMVLEVKVHFDPLPQFHLIRELFHLLHAL